MDFDFSDDQTQLGDAVCTWVDKGYTFERRRAITSAGGFDRAAYTELAELGLTGLYVSPDHDGMGMGPVSHQEIAAWQSLTGIPLTPWDARAIRRLSIEYSNWSIKAASADCKAPWMPEDHTVDKAQVANSMRDAMRKLAEI